MHFPCTSRHQIPRMGKRMTSYRSFVLFRYFCPNSRPGWILLGAVEERKKFLKSKLDGEWKHQVFSSSESRIKESMERKYTLLKLFPSFPLTNEVSALSNEPWELQRRRATQYGVLTPQLAAASDWSTALILASGWLRLTPACSLQSSGHKWDASLVLTGQSCAKKNCVRSKFY